MKKRITIIITAFVMLFTCLGGCGVIYEGDERSDVSYLYVDAYSGGFGVEFYEAIKESFEEKYKDESFAEGKKGVIVDISSSAGNQSTNFVSNIKSTPHDIHVVASCNYFDYLPDKTLLDITEWVKEKTDNGKSIEDKLFDDEIEALTASEGKYYSLPTFAGFTGFTYDAKLFKDNNLYFADDRDNGDYLYLTSNDLSSYTNEKYTGRGFIFDASQKKSCGPDGIYDTYDDGLPSSYEEFFYMCDKMLTLSITPFIFVNSHYIHYISNALLNANLTKAEMVANFTFNSGDEKVRYVDRFDANNKPIVKEDYLTQANGYLINQEYGKYLMCKFMYHLLTYENDTLNNYYHTRSKNQSLSNIQAERLFIESALDTNTTNDIAMLCEGNYWYNEAEATRSASIDLYKEKAKNRDFKYLPLPAIETGSVEENQGSSLTLTDNFANFLVVNSKVANNPEKLKLAKAFIQYMYTDDSLSAMNAKSGIPFMLKYDMKPSDYNSMDTYAKSLWDAYKLAKDNDAFSCGISGNKIFQNNYFKFYMSTLYNFYTTTVNGVEYSDIHTAFWNKKANAESWFNGMAISKNKWDTKYNIYG